MGEFGKDLVRILLASFGFNWDGVFRPQGRRSGYDKIKSEEAVGRFFWQEGVPTLYLKPAYGAVWSRGGR